MEEFLLEFINIGREHAIPCSKLSAMIGFTPSTIRAMIAELRSNGTPICSCSDGYYFGTTADVLNTIDGLERRIKNQQKAIDGLKGRIQNG